jgi:hypothetical protein
MRNQKSVTEHETVFLREVQLLINKKVYFDSTNIHKIIFTLITTNINYESGRKIVLHSKSRRRHNRPLEKKRVLIYTCV